jgi:hypothetical protein
MKLIIFLLLTMVIGCGRPRIYDKSIVTDINGTHYVLTASNWSDYLYQLDTIKLPNDSLNNKQQ